MVLGINYACVPEHRVVIRITFRMSDESEGDYFSVQEPGYDEAEYRTVYSDLIEPSASTSQFEVDRRLQDLAAPAINRVVRAAQQLLR